MLADTALWEDKLGVYRPLGGSPKETGKEEGRKGMGKGMEGKERENYAYTTHTHTYAHIWGWAGLENREVSHGWGHLGRWP